MFIKLTFKNSKIVRINVNHITDYGHNQNKIETGSYVILTNQHSEGDFLIVTETPEQIDQLIAATPTHPTVTGLSDLTD